VEEHIWGMKGEIGGHEEAPYGLRRKRGLWGKLKAALSLRSQGGMLTEKVFKW